MQEAQIRLNAPASDADERTYRNTLAALEDVTENIGHAMGVVGHLEMVATEPELRAAYNAVQPKVSEFYSSIALNEGVWKQLKAYAAGEEAKSLGAARARFLEKTLDGFRRSGAELDPPGKKRLAEINVELTKLTTKYSENVLDATNRFELLITDAAKLAGLPPGAVEAARESAKRKRQDGWRFTLQMPSLLAVLTYLRRRGCSRAGVPRPKHPGLARRIRQSRDHCRHPPAAPRKGRVARVPRLRGLGPRGSHGRQRRPSKRVRRVPQAKDRAGL